MVVVVACKAKPPQFSQRIREDNATRVTDISLGWGWVDGFFAWVADSPIPAVVVMDRRCKEEADAIRDMSL